MSSAACIAQSRSALPVRCRKTASRSGSSTSTELTATPASPRDVCRSSGSTLRAPSTSSSDAPSWTLAASHRGERAARRGRSRLEVAGPLEPTPVVLRRRARRARPACPRPSARRGRRCRSGRTAARPPPCSAWCRGRPSPRPRAARRSRGSRCGSAGRRRPSARRGPAGAAGAAARCRCSAAAASRPSSPSPGRRPGRPARSRRAPRRCARARPRTMQAVQPSEEAEVLARVQVRVDRQLLRHVADRRLRGRRCGSSAACPRRAPRLRRPRAARRPSRSSSSCRRRSGRAGRRSRPRRSGSSTPRTASSSPKRLRRPRHSSTLWAETLGTLRCWSARGRGFIRSGADPGLGFPASMAGRRRPAACSCSGGRRSPRAPATPAG